MLRVMKEKVKGHRKSGNVLAYTLFVVYQNKKQLQW